MRRATFWLFLLFVTVTTGPVLCAQATEIVTGAPPVGEAAEWGSSVVWAFLSSSFLEWLKRNQRIGVISDRMAWGAQRLLGILLAIATATGIHWSFNATAGQLVIDGLTWAMVSESLRQFCFNEIIYRTAVKPYGKDA